MKKCAPLTMPRENSNLPLLPPRHWLLFHWPCMNEQLSSIFITQIIIWFCFSSRWVEGQSKVEIQRRWKLGGEWLIIKMMVVRQKAKISWRFCLCLASEVYGRVHYFNATGSTTTFAVVVKSDGRWVTYYWVTALDIKTYSNVITLQSVEYSAVKKELILI